MNTIADPPLPAPRVDHGGDLAAARLAFPGAPEPWLDLSTGVNPNPYPLPKLPPEAWARLPDRAGLARLEQVAARRYRAPAGAEIVAAPGAQALIQILPRLLRAKTVGLLGFTYGEYEHVWRAAGAEIVVAETLDRLAACDLAIIVNPNNPDGRMVAPSDLAALAHALARRGGALLVDEAFIDAAPAEASLVPALPMGAIALRSFGKIYGLAGLRLGFALASPKHAGKLRALLGPWAVSGPAIEIGAAALADEAWLAATAADLAARAAALDRLLIRHGFSPLGGAPLFRLVAHPQADRIFRALGRQGVLARRFPTRPDWLRFGLPADGAGLARLEATLASA
ncbi:MAG TPA: threonine-phosphate decarboxylase CobD [Roseiarcus sp.]|nr:threonine-phosphate decarboxylase CobD [Roseiarcus sp.]